MSKFNKDWMILPNGVRVPRPKRTVHLNEPSIGPKAVSDTESGMYAQTSPSSNELNACSCVVVGDNRVEDPKCSVHNSPKQILKHFWKRATKAASNPTELGYHKDKVAALEEAEASIARLLLQAQITALEKHRFQLKGHDLVDGTPLYPCRLCDDIAALTKQMEE